MNCRGTDSTSSWDQGRRQGLAAGVYDGLLPRKSYLRLSPTAAVCIASVGLVLGLRDEIDPFGFRHRNVPAYGPEQAVDISVQRLMRLHLVQRLEREHRQSASPSENQATIDDELARIRVHPLYVVIRETMADHLRNEGFERVPIHQTLDPKAPMLSTDAEAALDKFLHTWRASFPAPDKTVETFLDDKAEIHGELMVARRGASGYDVVLPLLIQLVFECPDRLEPVAHSVRFLPRPQEEIQRILHGKASG